MATSRIMSALALLREEVYQDVSLISPALVFQPAGDMQPVGIMVRPMDDAAFRIPLILALEGNQVAFRQRGDPRRREASAQS